MKTEIAAGKPQKQAVAIAYATKRAAAQSDGGKGAQPGYGGANKAAHRREEHDYDEQEHSRKTGLPTMDAHADAMHPVKRR